MEANSKIMESIRPVVYIYRILKKSVCLRYSKQKNCNKTLIIGPLNNTEPPPPQESGYVKQTSQ